MKSMQLGLVLAVVGALFCWVDSAEAQYVGPSGPAPYTPYRPSRPTVSPYFELFRDDGPPIPNYQFFYRPSIERARRAESVNQQLRNQEQELQSLDQSYQYRRTPQITTGGVSSFQTHKRGIPGQVPGYFETHRIPGNYFGTHANRRFRFERR